MGPYGSSVPPAQRPSAHSAEYITGAHTAPKPSFCGGSKPARAAATPGATMTPAMSAPKVRIGARQPILPRRGEHIDVERVLERERTMRQVRGDDDDLARAHDELLLVVRPEPKLQGAFEYVGELLVVVRVARHVHALVKIDVRDHHA